MMGAVSHAHLPRAAQLRIVDVAICNACDTVDAFAAYNVAGYCQGCAVDAAGVDGLAEAVDAYKREFSALGVAFLIDSLADQYGQG